MKKTFMIIFCIFLASVSLEAVSVKIVSTIAKFSTHYKVLAEEEIIRLANITGLKNGTKQVGKILGNRYLPKDVLEDTYLRVALYRGKISKSEATKFYKNLGGVEGFSSTLSKVIGNSKNVTVGHLNELHIANSAVKNGFKVVGIGKKFNDGIKKSLTDIDILLHKNGRDILIEAKSYASGTRMPLDKFKSDLDTLNSYEKITGRESLKIFTFTEKPRSEALLKQYQFWADKKGVQLIFGSPAEQMEQIKILERIL